MTQKSRAWSPSKFTLSGGGAVVATRGVEGGSYLIASLVGEFYSRAVPEWVRGTLADVGCGSAPLYGLYQTYADAIFWLDWPASVHANAALDAECDLNVGLPVRDHAFDVVILSDVLEHIRQPTVVWNELIRTLAPGGVLLGNAPFMYWIHEAPHDYCRYTEFALRAAIADAGGEIVSIEAIGGSLDVLADFVGKHLGLFPLIGQPIARATARVALRFGRTRGAAHPRRIGVEVPSRLRLDRAPSCYAHWQCHAVIRRHTGERQDS